MEETIEKGVCPSCWETMESKLELAKNFNIFSSLSDHYVPERAYLSFFLEVPSSLTFQPIDETRFLGKFAEEFGPYILKEFCDKTRFKKDKEKLNDCLFLLQEKIIVHVEKETIVLLYSKPSGELLKNLQDFISGFYIKKKKKPVICVIISDGGYLRTRNIKFKKPPIDFQDNYCDDFLPMHKTVSEVLKRKKDSGLFLFHGKPGTGKSTYIRYLVKSIKKKTIFISPKMAGNLDSVDIIKLLLDNKNCILVIEDAEELVVSREHERNSNLSMILNLTDGILGESLGIQIIATFNTELKNIDSALMRKGRLKTAYEFKALPVAKTRKLLQKQGIEVAVQEPMTLAEIFNFSSSNEASTAIRKPMGFARV